MKKEKSDLEKWHKEYRKKHPEWKEKREARRRKELGIEDKFFAYPYGNIGFPIGF